MSLLYNWTPNNKLFRDGPPYREDIPDFKKPIADSMLDCGSIKNLVHFINMFLKEYNIKGKMLQVGASFNSMKQTEECFGLEAWNLDLVDDKQPTTIIGDVTNCPEIPNESFDFVFSSDTFEHLTTPWTAAKEMIRILKPNGLVFVTTLFSWRYHCCPIDYWRFTPQALMFLFKELECIEANWDIHNRRVPQQGRSEGEPDYDICPEDHFGPWMENWRVYYVGRKTT